MKITDTQITIVYGFLLFHYALQSKNVPLRKKLVYICAIAYLFLPIELAIILGLQFSYKILIPFYLTGSGAYLIAIQTLSPWISDDIQQQAKHKVTTWVGITFDELNAIVKE